MSPIIRRARATDVAHYTKRLLMPVPVHYFGYAVDLDDQLAGIGLVLWPPRLDERCFVMADVSKDLRRFPALVHRLAVRTLNAAKLVESCIYVLRDECEDSSCRWLSVLGFRRTDEVVDGHEVWRCD